MVITTDSGIADTIWRISMSVTEDCFKLRRGDVSKPSLTIIDVKQSHNFKCCDSFKVQLLQNSAITKSVLIKDQYLTFPNNHFLDVTV